MKSIITFILSLFFLISIGQEFNCSLQVSSQNIEGTDKSVFETLQIELQKFINEQKWTDYEFISNEMIDCSILINVTSVKSQDQYNGEITVVSSRPVYNSSYSTPPLTYLDKDFSFEYAEFQPLEFEETTHMSNLTSVIAFYLNIILGLDFDSYSDMGGTIFFEKSRTNC